MHENRSNTQSGFNCVVMREIPARFSGTSITNACNWGHSISSFNNQWWPWLYNLFCNNSFGSWPLEINSAGLSLVGTCFQFVGWVFDCISDTLLATNVFEGMWFWTYPTKSYCWIRPQVNGMKSKFQSCCCFNNRLSNISLPPFCLLKFAAMYKALQSSYLATLYTIWKVLT